MTKGATQKLTATSVAVAWTIYDDDINDKFVAQSIFLKFTTAPTSAGLVYLSIDSLEGAAYDGVIGQINPVGKTTIEFTGVRPVDAGSKLVVTYANPNTVEIVGEATLQDERFRN